MPDTQVKTLIDLERLGEFKNLLLQEVSAEDAKSLKTIKIEGNNVYFYRSEEPIQDGTTPAYTLTLPDATVINQAIANAKKAGDDAQSDVDALTEKVGTVPVDSTVMAEIAKAQTAATYDDTQVKADIQTNADAIAVINGNDSVSGSTDKKIKDAINDFATKITEDGVINTYKEVLDYISQHGSDFTALVGRVTTAEGKIETNEGAISDNADAIDSLETLIGSIPQDASAETIIAYIRELVNAEQTRATGVEDSLDTRLDVVEEAIGSGGAVSDQIISAINALDATVTNAVDGQPTPDVTVTITETDGKLTAVSATVNANYETAGAAATVQGNTTSTVADVEDDLDNFKNSIVYATSADIQALFVNSNEE